jgi:hypothetical protein
MTTHGCRWWCGGRVEGGGRIGLSVDFYFYFFLGHLFFFLLLLLLLLAVQVAVVVGQQTKEEEERKLLGRVQEAKRKNALYVLVMHVGGTRGLESCSKYTHARVTWGCCIDPRIFFIFCFICIVWMFGLT